MNELIKVNYDNDTPTVSARDLHEFLEVGTRFNDWFPRMCEYGFEAGKDYYSFLSNRADGLPGKPRDDAALTVPMAKEICMIQRSEKGKIARQYFLKLEEAWNSPDMVMSRALRMAEAQIKTLRADVAALTTENAIMAPKAGYFDQLVDRNLLTGIRETAKELGVKEKVFVRFLLEHKYLYRDKKGKLMPYAQYADDLFVLKESYNEKTQWTGTQLLVTPKGRETFRLLVPEAA